jgi:hypothetical protein
MPGVVLRGSELSKKLVVYRPIQIPCKNDTPGAIYCHTYKTASPGNGRKAVYGFSVVRPRRDSNARHAV